MGIHANTQFPIVLGGQAVVNLRYYSLLSVTICRYYPLLVVLGGQARYETTGEPSLREAARHFFELIRDTRTFATGGSTHGEIWGAPSGLGFTLSRPPVGTEHVESCTSHNMLKVGGDRVAPVCNARVTGVYRVRNV